MAAQDLRAAGWITIAALDAAADPHTEARRLGCAYLLIDGKVREL
jgi:hypothetical protein